MTKAHETSVQASAVADSPDRREFDVIVVGGGFAGIGVAIRLRQAGFDFILLEKAAELGGVWRENSYPDCACDVPSSFYSFSFAPKADWSHVFAHQSQIKRYAADTAQAFGVSDAIRFGHEMIEARWDPAAARWQVETNRGRFVARFVVMASGPMHKPVIPALPGMETFPGPSFHSAKWNHDVDLRGKRVAVIGTGASAIQFVPAIQPEVGCMAVFQRTAPWVLPKLDAPVSPTWQGRFRRHPITQRALRRLLYVQFEFLNWSLNKPRLRQRLEKAALGNAFRSIKDEGLRAKVVPNYSIGCKRILQSNVWYRALAQPNVSVLGGVQRVEGSTIVSSDGTRFEADVVVFATGFQVANPPIAENIVGASGRTLAEQWNGRPAAYLGTTVADCPNCFLMLGPNLYAFSSAFVMIEAQIDYVLSALTEARKRGIGTLALRPAPLEAYNAELQAALGTTVFNTGGCTSYFIDRTGRNSTNWPWTVSKLRRRLRRADLGDYETSPA